MAQPATVPEYAEQAKLLRTLAERVERGDLALPAELQSEVEQLIEDALDREAVRAAHGEPTVPWSKVKADLGC